MSDFLAAGSSTSVSVALTMHRHDSFHSLLTLAGPRCWHHQSLCNPRELFHILCSCACCNSTFCLWVTVFAILLQRFPGRHVQIENPPALPLMEMHCAPCSRWLLSSLQNSSRSREKPTLRCINVDYLQPTGNKKLLLCAVRHDNTPQKPSWTPRGPKHGNHCFSEMMPAD